MVPSSPCGSPLPLRFPMEEQRAPQADSRMGMSLFPCSVSPCEASLQGPEEPSRRPSPNEPWGLLAVVGRGRQAALGAHGVGSWAVPRQAGAPHEADGFNLTPGLL